MGVVVDSQSHCQSQLDQQASYCKTIIILILYVNTYHYEINTEKET